MKPTQHNVYKECFVLACRILGMWTLLSTFGYLVTAFDISTGFYKPTTSSNTLGAAMTHALVWLLISLWLLKGARKIADFFYREPPQSPASDDHVSDKSTPTI